MVHAAGAAVLVSVLVSFTPVRVRPDGATLHS